MHTARHLFVILVFTFGLLEASLQLFPQVVSLPLLFHFNPELRERLAAKRGLQTKLDRVQLERTDGGPPLWIWKPNENVNRNYRDENSVAVVKMDQVGFCNSPPDYYDKPEFDVIVIGDSFTWCEGVAAHQTWPNIVREQMRVSVYNLGMPGVGPYEYLQIFERFGIEKSPKLVIMNIYEGNDLGSAAGHERYAKSTQTRPVTANGLRGAYQKIRNSYVFQHSIVLNLLFAIAKTAYAWSAGERDVSYHYAIRTDDGQIPFNIENTDLNEVTYAQALQHGEIAVDSLGPPLLRFREIAENVGFTPVVMYSPSAHTVYSRHVIFDDPEVGKAVVAHSLEIRQFLKQFTAQHGLIFLDLTQPLQAAAEPVSVHRLHYFPYNLHYTQFGHRAVGELVADFLINLIPQH
ncbi:MAG: hypothetical protein ACR2RB_21690 [Gammaproteobacteria bacterium]